MSLLVVDDTAVTGTEDDRYILLDQKYFKCDACGSFQVFCMLLNRYALLSLPLIVHYRGMIIS
jgi:hypothetical protein